MDKIIGIGNALVDIFFAKILHISKYPTTFATQLRKKPSSVAQSVRASEEGFFLNCVAKVVGYFEICNIFAKKISDRKSVV